MSVFANTREISGKATPNKTIAAFPDVCLSPPSPPAGPIPIPYPLTGMASDTTDGTSSVFIKGKEAGKKNGVKYSKVNGNQPATNSFGANVISHKITGPLKFAAYSFDVMIEGGGAERFMDLTTQNHMNTNGGSMGASGAGLNPPPPAPDPECVTLNRETTRMRQATSSNQALAEDARRQRTAYTKEYRERAEANIDQRMHGAHTACSVSGGPPVRYTSNQLNRATLRQNGIAVESQPPVTNTDSNVCGQNTPYEAEEHKYHTESQMLEAIYQTNPPPASITFSTNWPAMSNGRLDRTRANRPCENCRTKMVEACNCGLKIDICDGTNRVDYCKSQGAGQ